MIAQSPRQERLIISLYDRQVYISINPDLAALRVLTENEDLLEAPGLQVAPGLARQVASPALHLSVSCRGA